MIDWREAENCAFWVDDAQHLVGTYYLDKSKSPKLWRLRFHKFGDEMCVVLRVAKGNLTRAYEMTYPDLRTLIPNIALAAKAFGLKPRGNSYRLKFDWNVMMKTSLTEQP
jgi:hypothetical protein